MTAQLTGGWGEVGGGGGQYHGDNYDFIPYLTEIHRITQVIVTAISAYGQPISLYIDSISEKGKMVQWWKC